MSIVYMIFFLPLDHRIGYQYVDQFICATIEIRLVEKQPHGKQEF